MSLSLESSIMDYSQVGALRAPDLKALETRLGPLMLAEDNPPPRCQIVNGRIRIPLYGLGWKFTWEEKLELAPEVEAKSSTKFANALGAIWLESELSSKYHWKDQPDLMNTGTVHGPIFIVQTNLKPPSPESKHFIQEVMDLYQIENRPNWYIFADLVY
ncbi:hypothetical protein VNI00_014739 [Paramarasmius palmivorus]|uniref:Uncharacterized protein n=1 Tax=Paramarasmius palmivorus TaxID=297713 RepID=A0AAW0BS53_9AGAR